MLRRINAALTVSLLGCLAAIPLGAQDARIGLAAPLTLSGQILRTERARAIDPDSGAWHPGLRLTAYPALKFGDHWYIYSALQLTKELYSYYETYYPESGLETRWMQAFLGYQWTGEGKAFSVRAGQLPPAFGAYPLRYDDAINPMLDLPLGYSQQVKLRPDGLPCGTKDLPNLREYSDYVGVRFYCGGDMMETHGMPVIDLYGLPGAELDLSLGNFDARFQLTNSSPSNPQSLGSESQHVQWTTGGGWTLWQGFRIGGSAHRGPFMDEAVQPRLPGGESVRDYPSAAIGADVQWARGHWSVSGEWYRAHFPYPRLIVAPVVNSVYGEAKVILSPRLFGAIRGSWQFYNRVEDSKGRGPLPFQPNTQSYEIAFGYRPNRWQLLKVGYEWLGTDGETGTHNNVLGIQWVTSLDSLSIALR